MPAGTPTLEEMLGLAMDARLADLHVALPGRVESYDRAAQTADIRPMVRRLVPSGGFESEDIPEEMPVLPAVPVLHPRGGGFSIHLPIEVGDTVLLLFLERDPVEWRRTGEVSTPGDHRLHSLAHAVAIPGLFPSSQPIASTQAGALTLGQDGGLQVSISPSTMAVGGETDSAALASKVDQLANVFWTHTHVSQNNAGPPGPTSPPVQAAVAQPLYITSASNLLKVGG